MSSQEVEAVKESLKVLSRSGKHREIVKLIRRYRFLLESSNNIKIFSISLFEIEHYESAFKYSKRYLKSISPRIDNVFFRVVLKNIRLLNLARNKINEFWLECSSDIELYFGGLEKKKL